MTEPPATGSELHRIAAHLGSVDADLIKSAADELVRLRQAAKDAIELIDKNLYHQREKVEDASFLLRRALNPPF